MLPIRLQIILLFFSGISMLISIKMIRKFELELKYALFWLILNFIIFVLAAYPPLLFYLASIMAIEVPVNALFLFGIIILMFIIFSLTVALSRTSYKVKMISQELGILKAEMQKLSERKSDI